MAFSMISQNGNQQYGYAEFVMDEDKDIQDLPVNVKMGSIALSIASGKIFMKGSNGWRELGGAG